MGAAYVLFFVVGHRGWADRPPALPFPTGL